MNIKKIRSRLREMEKTPDWLAEEIGISPVTLHVSYLGGHREPSKVVAVAISKQLGLTMKELEWTGPKSKKS